MKMTEGLLTLDNPPPRLTASLALGAPRFDSMPAATALDAEAAWQQLVARHGNAAPAQVSGDFAIALRYDDGRVFLAVDRFAIRTLCYRVVEGQLRFAERADALGASEIDAQSVFDYLFFHNIPSPRTIFKDVFRVPPAHSVSYENGHLKVEPYWVASFDESRAGAFEPLKSEFRQLLDDAVRTQAGSMRPQQLACFLSGGTDSSTVAGVLGEVLGEPAATYSIGFDVPGYDEMKYARIAAERFRTRHHEYYVTPADLTRSIPTVAGHYDQPFGNSSALPAYYCARMAKADGVEKILAGDGGDELFGGNSRYAKQRVFGWYDSIPSALRKGLLEPASQNESIGRIPLIKKGVSYVQQARVPLPDRTEMYNLLLRLGTADVLTSDFLARIDQLGPLRMQQQTWQQAKAGTLINRMLAFDWRYTLAENDLPKVCGTTRLADIAVGFPLLDQRLLDFSLRLPADYKLKGLKLRWFFKEALRGFLPDEIITKKKQGFGLPFGVWACSDPALRQLAADSLASLRQRNLVKTDFLDRLVSQLLPEHPGYYGEMVWILMMLEQWLQQHAPSFRIER